MAALLTAAEITALETKISALKTLTEDIRDQLNTLYTKDPRFATHAAWRPLTQARASLIQAVLGLREAIVQNKDAFGTRR